LRAYVNVVKKRSRSLSSKTSSYMIHDIQLKLL